MPSKEPLKQIAVNAGLGRWRGGRAVCATSRSPAEGLNAATGEYEDLIKAGVIDAAKVTRSALQNAASIAALFLTTEAVIVDKPEKEAPGHARWRHGGLLVPPVSRVHPERIASDHARERPSGRSRRVRP